ncbi:MAG: hypothetical protein QXP43_07580 [Nitrososphaerota archaeon]
MLEEAIRKIEELRQRAERFRAELSKNEMLTRYALIDPFLRLLGWNTEDPAQVKPEYSTGAGRPDYALMRDDGKTVLAFIGAKSLGKTEDLTQYIAYCVQEGVKYFVATDGVKWEVYDTFKERPLSEKRITSWDILNEPPGEVLRKAFVLFRFAPFSGEAPAPIGQAQPQVNVKVDETEGVPLSDLRVKPGSALSYRIIRFPDGREYEVRWWNDLLEQSAKWLVETGRLTRDKLPIPLGGTRYLVHHEPVHPNGKRFRNPKHIGDFWVETHDSAERLVEQATRLLQQYGNVDPRQVILLKR